MEKIASSLKNMIVVLFVITFVSGLSLAYVKQITLDPIAKAQEQKQIDAIAIVLPAFDNNPLETAQEIVSPQYKGEKMMVYTAINKGDTVGYAILSSTNSGFGGKVEVMVGFNPDGTIYNTAVVSHQETPGLGTKMADWFKSDDENRNIRGKNPAIQNLTVSKDGGDIDAITAATISSRAFLFTIRNAYHAYKNSLDVSDTSTSESNTALISTEK